MMEEVHIEDDIETISEDNQSQKESTANSSAHDEISERCYDGNVNPEANPSFLQDSIQGNKYDKKVGSESNITINNKFDHENGPLVKKSEDLIENGSGKNDTIVESETSNNKSETLDNYDKTPLDQHCNGLSVGELEQQNGQLLCSIEEQKRVIELLRIELTRKEEALAENETKSNEAIEVSKLQLTKVQDESAKRINELRKAFDHANKEKESAVIKYAMGEKEIIIARRGKETAEKKLSEVNKDKESLNYKIKTLNTERTRLQGLCDVRNQETISAKREGEKWREECRMTETKLTAITTKYNSEQESHRETKETLDRTLSQLAELQGSVEKVRGEYQEMIDKQKEKERDMRRVEKEQEVKLMIDGVAAQELDTLRKKHKTLLEENNQLSVKVQAGEKERLSLESQLSEVKETMQKQKAEILDMYSKCAELESVKLQLDKEVEKCVTRDEEILRLRSEAKDLQSDMSSCRAKEADLLDFTQKLTDKNVNLQSEFSSLEARSNCLEQEHSRLVVSLAETETKLSETETKLGLEIKDLSSLNKFLQSELNARAAEFGTASQQSVDAKNEVEVLRRQHTARIKELTKELNAAKKRLEEFRGEAGSPVGLSPMSRSSSNTSLNRPELQADLHTSPGLLKPVSPRYAGPPSPSRVSLSSNHDSDPSDLTSLPDTQIMIEKIVKLQKSCAKRQEKVDFLEEHVEQLLAEVKKKNKIIQHYAMNIQPGALISEESDLHKGVMTQQGGIMSSIYGSKVKDSGMTLDLSMEMNKKLQAVLEDTLLKNIFLKENINTLGMEIQKIKSAERVSSDR